MFAPFSVDVDCGQTLSRFYQHQISGRKVLIVDDVLNTGQTLARCVELVRAGGGTVIATAEIYDRMEAVVRLDVPNYPLAEYKAPENFLVSECPLCASGVPVSRF
jgi:orotate phosphoribosyltransferase